MAGLAFQLSGISGILGAIPVLYPIVNVRRLLWDMWRVYFTKTGAKCNLIIYKSRRFVKLSNNVNQNLSGGSVERCNGDARDCQLIDWRAAMIATQ